MKENEKFVIRYLLSTIGPGQKISEEFLMGLLAGAGVPRSSTLEWISKILPTYSRGIDEDNSIFFVTEDINVIAKFRLKIRA